MKNNVWPGYGKDDIEALERLSDGYRSFISECKTERECTDWMIKAAEAKGYRNLNDLIKSGQTLRKEVFLLKDGLYYLRVLFRVATDNCGGAVS